MEEFVTIGTFMQPHKVYIIMGRLQSEGITCRLKDENTVNLQYYSNAISGLKLQVRRMDYERAKAILEENGYHFTEPDVYPSWYIFLLQKSAAIPFLKDYSLGKRILILVLVLFTLIGMLLYYLTPEAPIE